MSLAVTAKVVTRAEIAGRPFYTASEFPQISKTRLGPGQHRHLPFVADGLPRTDLGVVMCIAALLWDPLSIDEVETLSSRPLHLGNQGAEVLPQIADSNNGVKVMPMRGESLTYRSLQPRQH